MDNKYGQLYTQADIDRLLDSLPGTAGEGLGIAGEVKETLDGIELTFPPDMPLFLLIGKDRNVPGTLEEYEVLCDENGSPPEHVAGIAEAREQIRVWQNSHPDRVKMPD